jgi:hypothetical protein
MESEETIDLFEYTIADHFLNAIINEDTSSLSEEEVARLEVFLGEVVDLADDQGEFMYFYYAGSGEQVARCEITGLLASVMDLIVIFKRKD